LTVHFARCILAPLSLPQASTWPHAERNESSGGLLKDRLPNCSSLIDTQCGSATTLRGEMGLFPFASTIGTMSTFPVTASVRRSRRARQTESACCWRAPNHTDNSYSPRSPSPLLPQSHSSSSHNFASCFGTARCPDAVARPAGIRSGVARRTSGRTLSRSARRDRSGAERGPPSGP
jgi:hypothetical protein